MGCSSNFINTKDNIHNSDKETTKNNQMNNDNNQKIEKLKSEDSNKISFRCTYDIKDENEIQIINCEGDDKIDK